MEPTPLTPLSRLSADPDSEEDQSEPEDETESEPPSSYAENAIRHLESIYQKLYPVKDPQNFADRWPGFGELSAAIKETTQATQPVILARYPVNPEKPANWVPTAQDPLLVRKKRSALFGYVEDIGQSLVPGTEISQQLHAAATGTSSTAPQHKLLFLADSVASIKPLATGPAGTSAPIIFSRPIILVTGPAQPTSTLTSSNATAAAHPPQDVTSTQPATQQSAAAVSTRIRSVSITSTASNPDDDVGNNNSNRLASSTPLTSYERYQSVASTSTLVMWDSKLKIHKLEKNSGVGKWRQAAVFDNWVDAAMDQLLIGNLCPESNVAMVWLDWYLKGEAKIHHSSVRKISTTKYLGITPFLTELKQFCIPLIKKANSGPNFRISNKLIMVGLGQFTNWPTRLSKCRYSYTRWVIGRVTTNSL